MVISASGIYVAMGRKDYCCAMLIKSLLVMLWTFARAQSKLASTLKLTRDVHKSHNPFVLLINLL